MTTEEPKDAEYEQGKLKAQDNSEKKAKNAADDDEEEKVRISFISNCQDHLVNWKFNGSFGFLTAYDTWRIWEGVFWEEESVGIFEKDWAENGHSW